MGLENDTQLPEIQTIGNMTLGSIVSMGAFEPRMLQHKTSILGVLWKLPTFTIPLLSKRTKNRGESIPQQQDAARNLWNSFRTSFVITRVTLRPCL